MMREVAAAVLMLAVLLLPALGATAAERPGATWSELAPLVRIDVGPVKVELVEVSVESVPGGGLSAVSAYVLSNPTRHAVAARVAIPLTYKRAIDYLGGEEAVVNPAPSAPPAVEVGVPPKPLPADAFERVPLPAGGPLGHSGEGVAFTIDLPRREARRVTVRQPVSWAKVRDPRHFPGERAFSISFEGLRDWGGDHLTSAKASLRLSPPLLGPASFASPLPYAYDSKGLAWTFAKAADGSVEIPDRITIVVFDDYDKRSFAGVYFARFDATTDDYPWGRRFFHANPLTTRPDGRRVIRQETVAALVKQLDEIERFILAHNGKRFEDTFIQMRFQKEPWYRPDGAFSEDHIRPVEKWNLDYARCEARAARTVSSALQKMHAEEMLAQGRRFKILMEAFQRCDERFWNPQEKKRGRKLLR